MVASLNFGRNPGAVAFVHAGFGLGKTVLCSKQQDVYADTADINIDAETRTGEPGIISNESRIVEVQFSKTMCNDESAQMISISASYRLYSNFH